MKKDIKKLISEMTLEEKASLCSGLNLWQTKPIERLGIPSITMTDGPHGLRKAKKSDNLGLDDSVPATCFPSGSALAASWDRDLIKKVGEAIGEECIAEDVHILLGPAINIKRSPLCGRNFEYLSEDPYLISELAANYIKGVQSKGVGTSIKHYAANNQEDYRMTVDVKVNERALREIYLTGFEGAIKQSQPWTVMASYNKVNGVYATENEHLINEILRNEWKFDGIVISDWGAVNDRVAALKAGLDIEMPGSGGEEDKKIVEAVKKGQISEEYLNSAVERILNIIFKAYENKKKNQNYDAEKHHQLARQVASECMVLLKNEDEILPLKKQGKIAIIGELAVKPRYQGGGSSHIVPTKLDIPYDKITKIAGNKAEIKYTPGYELEKDEVNNKLIEEAAYIAKNSDVAVIFAGLPDSYESEGYDREHMRIPESHNKLIQAIAEVQPNVVVVLCNGSPIEMPWVHQVKGILEAYLGGQASGGAIADILFGEKNPCGKLAETFPRELRNNPSYLNFPGEKNVVNYGEGIFVGYRYYDTKGVEPLFPFGHGLSYTTFEYTDISTNKNKITEEETIEVRVKVKNTGKRAGKEIIQLYVRDIQSSVTRPHKELKGFQKIYLEPGEEKTVVFNLDKRSFAYYDVDSKDWYVETGDFEILVGSSSKNILLKTVIHITSTTSVKKEYTRNSTINDVITNQYGRQIIYNIIKRIKSDTNDSQDMLNILKKQLETNSQEISSSSQKDMMNAFLKNMPLRALTILSNGIFTEEMVNEVVDGLNTISN
ncbi:glycoside hydrolase family 3 domain protein [Thermoanaerobacterium thermosaccharolyticum DSM 571]|jgi:beta-glucosidase|uniref:Glycoside hydrolase family 3 domain protein n=1 Tax=Thermoanaerobacterium thermosaccharolyticum (strain ATCC 7956 / DSM 571 / NCIMB 9385 / NCA 3814 / NCTC 13789 / WDCM 00135 / 2032) TaxID=580327 RepID=D9TTJ4_THETC|nr:glycoside hydrolase family 3 C-terminal domain-containing protein [Thermoanaerobacterium thermosaccharolyticum]ADL68251.1 glycoside hydrolase family 3 domain protein [Thermoanaerobacterium thermosaccharolyticum DSM 571]